MDVKDKVIAITGSGRGLGRAMAVEFAKKGAKIALIDVDPNTLEEAASAIKEAGSEAKTYVCNIAKEDQVTQLFDDIVTDFGTLDGLINNAGILRDAMLIKVKDGQIEKRMTLEQWQAVIDVNLTGVFLCGREAATKMIELGKPGVIINISSIAKDGNIGQTNYSAAKAGVASMAVVWAKELARYGIRSAAIAPGFIATDMVASMKPEALEKMTKGIPLRRMGQPEEIAQTAIYIFENEYVTGRVHYTDGGLSI